MFCLITCLVQNTAEEELVRLTGQGRVGRAAVVKSLIPENVTVAEKDQVKAQDVFRRNHILREIKRVPEKSLPEYRNLRV